MIAYRYTIGNTTTETIDLNSIPKDTIWEIIEVQLEAEAPIVTEPTKEELIQIVQELQEKLTQVTEQLNNL
jgi:MinD-like ATPase involved in chromosome partitioning or flagellar assembly